MRKLFSMLAVAAVAVSFSFAAQAYEGKEVTGWPIGTIVRGHRVMWEGALVTPSQGEPVLFNEALPR